MRHLSARTLGGFNDNFHQREYIMRFLTLLVLLVLFSQPSIAQTPSSTVADSLMDKWVHIWNSDDAQALKSFYSDDVASSADGSHSMLKGKEAVLNDSINKMEQTDGLEVYALYSYQENGEAYHIGRFTINVKGNPTTGSYTFFFRKDSTDHWQLRYTYFVHDPVNKLEEFKTFKK